MLALYEGKVFIAVIDIVVMLSAASFLCSVGLGLSRLEAQWSLVLGGARASCPAGRWVGGRASERRPTLSAHRVA